jgi:hypothetical protein
MHVVMHNQGGGLGITGGGLYQRTAMNMRAEADNSDNTVGAEVRRKKGG